MGHVWRSRILVVLVCLTAFLVEASVLTHHYGFPLDDSWIHQTVAQNLMDYKVLGYLPGIHSSGSSSLLWTLILTAEGGSPRWIDPVLYSTLVNGLLLGFIGLGLKILAERDGWDEMDSWILALAPALSGNFLWLGMLGMEHVLFVALSVGVLLLWFADGERRGWGGVAVASVLMALLGLTRPEGVALIGVLLIYRVAAHRTWGEFGVVFVGALAALAISFRLNWTASHTLLPLTMKGRTWLYFHGFRIGRAEWMTFEHEWVLRLMRLWWEKPIVSPQSQAGQAMLSAISIALVLALVLAAGAMYLKGRVRVSALVLWMLGLNLVYMVIMPSSGHGGRYQPLQMLLVLPLVWLAVLRVARWLCMRAEVDGPAANRYAATGTVVLMAIAAGFSYATWRGLLRDGIDQINQEHGVMAVWVRENLPNEAVRRRKIAVFDIGRIGYEIHGSLLDLGGLTDPEYLPYLTHQNVPTYLKERGITYVVMPTSPVNPMYFEKKLLPRNGEKFDLLTLKTICFPVDKAQSVMDGTGAALPCQTAYEIRFADTAESSTKGD